MRPWRIKSGAGHGFSDKDVSAPKVSSVLSERTTAHSPGRLDTIIGDQVAAIFERANDPSDGVELCTLAIARTESRLGNFALRPELAMLWHSRPKLRTVNAEDVLRDPALTDLTRRLFNFFFQRDLYGDLASADTIILSSGSFDESAFGLPTALKQCVHRALQENWYGYSHSNGREQTRAALALLETRRSAGMLSYTSDRVAVTLGGTSAMSTIAACASADAVRTRPLALCAIPNYPPLVSSVAERFDVELVPTSIFGQIASARELIRQIDIRKPDLVLLQSPINPSGAKIDEDEIARVIRAAPSTTRIVLDESHECFKPWSIVCPERGASNVVRLFSFSKAMAAPGLKIGWIASSAEFVEAFYERASVAYGSPVSLFYLLIEVYARFETWRFEGREGLEIQELQLFENAYALDLRALNQAYVSYCGERSVFERNVVSRRDEAVRFLEHHNVQVLDPGASINVFFRLPGLDSYTAFRQILAQSGVALYPGLLAFCSEDCWLRLSPCVAPDVLAEGCRRFTGWIQNAPRAS